MKLLPIYQDDAPELQVQCVPVLHVTKELMELAFDMCFTMKHYDGVGLAANQVGKNIRLIVINTIKHESNGVELIMFNPVITARQGSIKSTEGCLSLPGQACVIKRSRNAKVKYLSVLGIVGEREFGGLTARAIQHEIEHLDAVLMNSEKAGIK